MHRKHKCVSLKVGLQLEISYYSFETHQLTTEHWSVEPMHREFDSLFYEWDSAGLRARWSGVRVPVGARNLSPHHGVLSGSGAAPSLLSNGYQGFFPWG
jgi:hypothetical protein